EQLAASRDVSYNLTGGREPVQLAARRVTPNYLTTFRTQPALGRDFSEEEAATKSPVAILTHGFWLRHLAGRLEAIGETIQLDGQPFTIIGVMPDSFQRDSRTELFTPLDYADNRQNHGAHTLQVYGRLREGVTVKQARIELAAIAQRMEQQYPATNTGWSTRVLPMFEFAVGNVSRLLYPLLGAVGFLLLIACANVANLQLARATARAREISVRVALGATRGRVVRQLLAESVLLAVLGGALGVLFAKWGMDALLAFAPDSLPRSLEIALDGRALGFASATALLTGVGFGLVPALRATRLDLNETLKDSGRGTSAGASRQRFRGALVVVEIALALVLLVGAGLLGRSFLRLLEVKPGFQPNDAIAVSLALPGKKYPTAAQQVAFVDDATARLGAIPGVQSVGAGIVLPFSGDDINRTFRIVGRPPLPPGTLQVTLYYAITPDYFHAMGIPLQRGRGFTAADRAGASRVTLINETMGKKYFPGEDPIGQHLNLNGTDAEIVGIVADVKSTGLNATAPDTMYLPLRQWGGLGIFLVASTEGDPQTLQPLLRAAVAEVDRAEA
ncbi:MAG: ABC transporter permease, partial [Pseudomonadota bacterium]